ncbi:sigma-70 family RNA polymerase sigma factor [Ammonifex thiophilus]|uniref:sigma-70 family RNA polymerase sigma factor n=1 Tax=Ammonifex thiophilus TaxID=444093 RepID=UPI0014023707|nr:sigma-70 family RNA polymerase sigma factor [Ammonifex thiophilus]
MSEGSEPVKLDQLLGRARAGDGEAREELLRLLRPFVLRVASHFFKRPVTWSDEAASVAFLALNEAIDQHDDKKGSPFLAFARWVIRSRLIDFCRRENCSWVSLEEAGLREKEGGEAELAWERREEIERYAALLSEFGIKLSDLVKASPKHRDTRERFIKAAKALASEEALFDQLRKTKRLPLNELASLTGIPRKTLERGRRYLLALSLIFGCPEEFPYLYSYLHGILSERREEK